MKKKTSFSKKVDTLLAKKAKGTIKKSSKECLCACGCGCACSCACSCGCSCGCI